MGVYFKGYEVSPWDITKSYPIGSVVKYDGREYLAKKDVPVGINIGMSDYWDFGDDERLDNLEEAVDEIDATVQNLELDSLTDVNITNVQNGQTLIYDAETEQFVNATNNNGIHLKNYVEEVGTYVDGSKLYRITLKGKTDAISTNVVTPLLNVTDLHIKEIVSADGFGLVQSPTTPSTYRYANAGHTFYVSANPLNNLMKQIQDISIVQNYTNPAVVTYSVTVYFICEESEESEE